MDPEALGLMRVALGSARASRALIEEAGSLRRALDIPGDDLVARYGVARRRAAVWESLRLLRGRAALEGARRGTPLTSPQLLHALLAPLFAGQRCERFYVLAVDPGLHLLRPPILVGEGGPDFVALAPRRIFDRLLREEAAAAFLAHNHPSGDPTPSAEDRRLTRVLTQVGSTLGVQILDHLVVGDGRARSIAQGIEVAG
jgi:DNA repair protein RadC